MSMDATIWLTGDDLSLTTRGLFEAHVALLVAFIERDLAISDRRGDQRLESEYHSGQSSLSVSFFSFQTKHPSAWHRAIVERLSSVPLYIKMPLIVRGLIVQFSSAKVIGSICLLVK